MVESKFQRDVIDDLHEMFPGCMILKNDSGYKPGIPDLLILYKDKWAMLEVKKSEKSPYRPNQEWYIDLLDEMSFASMICPENKEMVYNDLQHAFRTAR